MSFGTPARTSDVQAELRADILLGVREDDENSTASALGHAARSSEDAVLGIAWVHPEPRFDPLQGNHLTFGRSDTSSIRLDGQQVSRCHATAMRSNSPGWVLADEGSKNGVFVDGVRVRASALSPQNVVRLGDWVGVVTELQGKWAPSGALTRELGRGIYGGPKLAAPFEALAAVAESNLSVVLVGETGTGKEVFARTLHALSGRTGKLIAVNCAAIPRHLAESELFGYRKGAFTGADRHHAGYLREADGGTLLLDEITDLDTSIQAKLLRALEERAVVALGDTRAQPIDLRVAAATQRSLHDAVEAGLFRADLMGRLCGVELYLPPLRRRREEIVDLFLIRLREESGEPRAPRVSADLAERLCLYDWPLNVRELVQVARRARVLHPDVPILSLEHVPPRIGDRGPVLAEGRGPMAEVQEVEAPRGPSSNQPPASRAERSLAGRREQDQRDLEKLVSLLDAFHGNVNQAAKRMGISRQRAYRLMDLRPDLDVQTLRQPGRGERE
jgi:DNA-binding NtrC family response regulator